MNGNSILTLGNKITAAPDIRGRYGHYCQAVYEVSNSQVQNKILHTDSGEQNNCSSWYQKPIWATSVGYGSLLLWKFKLCQISGLQIANCNKWWIEFAAVMGILGRLEICNCGSFFQCVLFTSYRIAKSEVWKFSKSCKPPTLKKAWSLHFVNGDAWQNKNLTIFKIIQWDKGTSNRMSQRCLMV